MAKITRVELLMVDLTPKVKRVDAIQSFVSQETPIVRITDADGVTGTGYSYTIGTGGHSVMELLKRTLGPAVLGREALEIERIWRDLLFLTHATSVGAITSIALAAIDTALWDLKCRKLGLPLRLLAGGAQSEIPLYTTEGGWLHLETSALVDDAVKAKADGFGGSKIKVGRSIHEDVARISAVRDAVGRRLVAADGPDPRRRAADRRRHQHLQPDVRERAALHRADAAVGRARPDRRPHHRRPAAIRVELNPRFRSASPLPHATCLATMPGRCSTARSSSR